MSPMTLSEELEWRGFVNQTTFDDTKTLDAEKLTFYHGFDASADSQTIGNLAAMMMDKVFMRHGYKAVLLAGGATSLIGDPGGKDKERNLQDEATVAANVKNAEKQLQKIFSGLDFTLVNNLDWYKDMNVLHFLRDVGKHFSMTPLVQRDYISKRMGTDGAGISYTEFSYTILQGYDFWHLYKEHGVKLQLAGSDQWGNSLSGVDLIRRAEGAEAHVITCSLIIDKTTGKKFGKSEAGAVWLDENKTSVYQFYQFWLNVADEGVEEYLKIYTEFNPQEVQSIMDKFTQDRSTRHAQKALAYAVTMLVHGKEKAENVRRVSEVVFGARDFKALSQEELELLASEIPVVQAQKEDNLAVLLKESGLSSSLSESKRFIESGGVYVNNQKSDRISEDMFHQGRALIRRGKNKIALIKK